MKDVEAKESSQQRIRSGSRFAVLRMPLVLLLITIGFYWKLTLTRQYNWAWPPDQAQQVFPWLEEQSRQFHQGRFPLWDPHTWAGQPFPGQAQPGTAYPLNWLLFALPRLHDHLRMGFVQWYFVVIHYMAVLFAYLLCRDLGRSRLASLTGAVLFGFAGYVGSATWPQMLSGAVWIPLVWMFLLRAVRGVRPFASAALCGLSLGLSWLSGHHQAPMYLTLSVCGLWLYFFLDAAKPRANIVKLAATSFGIAVLTGALQILPAAEYGKLALRWAGTSRPLGWQDVVPYSVHTQYSFSPMAVLGMILPGYGSFTDPFLGVAAFSLVLIAVAVYWRQHAVKLFAVLGLAGLFYALGSSDVLQGVLYAIVPMLEKARHPASAIVIFSCAAAVLAAFGTDWMPGPPDSPWPKRIMIGCLALGGILAVLFAATKFIKGGEWKGDERIGITLILAILFALLLNAWRSGAVSHRTAQILLVLIVLVEAGNAAQYLVMGRNDPQRNVYLQQVTGYSDIAKFLAKQPGPFRIDASEDLAMNWGEYYNFDFLRAFTPSVTANLGDLEYHRLSTRRLFGVRYIVSKKRPGPEMRDVFTDISRVKVWEDAGAFPRAWTVHETFRLPGVIERRRLIDQRLEELRRRAFIDGEPEALDACTGEDAVSFLDYQPDYVRLRASMSCRGMLVLSDTFYPDWKAAVDGREVPIRQVNFGMRGVVIPAGVHEVRFVYRPLRVYAGAILTALGAACALGIVVFSRRRERRLAE